MGLRHAVVGMLLTWTAAKAQQVRVCVVDSSGLPVQTARVTAGDVVVALDTHGCGQVMSGDRVRVESAGFADVTLTTGAAENRVVLQPATTEQSVTVTADRGLTGIDDAASSIAVLTQQQMQNAPGLTLDDALHQVAGFQLFRRTSSWTANPTTAGVSLRGLGSTAASRTLVVSDQVPLNGPFGGWVHWDEIPQTAIRDVELIRAAQGSCMDRVRLAA